MEEWIVGVIAVLGTVVVGMIANLVAYRNTQRQLETLERQFQAQERRADREREDSAESILRKYRDPLARAAFDLQSRLYNIALHRFLDDYLLSKDASEKEYARESTLYVIGEYFSWVEIQRREIQFLDLRDAGRNQELSALLDAISVAFLSKTADPVLRVFRNEQRAIGEVMMAAGPASGTRECIGYAEFVRRRSGQEFARWFAKLESDTHQLARTDPSECERLIAIQHLLIDLLDFLDPGHEFFPERRRRKIERTRQTDQWCACRSCSPSEPGAQNLVGDHLRAPASSNSESGRAASSDDPR